MNEDKPEEKTPKPAEEPERSNEINTAKVLAMGGKLQKVARGIHKRLDQIATRAGYKPWGFTLLVFAFDGPEQAYISNCQRPEMIVALRAQADHLERGMLAAAEALEREQARKKPQ